MKWNPSLIQNISRTNWTEQILLGFLFLKLNSDNGWSNNVGEVDEGRGTIYGNDEQDIVAS